MQNTNPNNSSISVQYLVLVTSFVASSSAPPCSDNIDKYNILKASLLAGFREMFLNKVTKLKRHLAFSLKRLLPLKRCSKFQHILIFLAACQNIF